MITTQEMIDLIKTTEVLKLKAYKPKPTEPGWTIGYGCKTYQDGSPVKEGDTISVSNAIKLFNYHIEKFEEGVCKLVRTPLNPNQISALVSFAFNIGMSAFSTSTTLKEINKGNLEAGRLAMMKFNKMRNPTTNKLEVVDGLTNRRQREMDYFNKPYIHS